MVLRKILDRLLELYFFGMGIFFEFGAVVSLAVFFAKTADVGIITAIKTCVFGLLFLYSGMSLLRKETHRYKYCLLALGLVFVVATLDRLFFITHFRLEQVDLQNLLLFGIPFSVTLLSSKLVENLGPFDHKLHRL